MRIRAAGRRALLAGAAGLALSAGAACAADDDAAATKAKQVGEVVVTASRQDLLGTAEGWLAVDHPVGASERLAPGSAGTGLGQRL